jgi:PRTRC genetic system protein C
MTRVFVYDGRSFPDPDPALSVEQMRQQLAEYFPELANAETREEQRGEDRLFTFARRIGTKGARPRRAPTRRIAGILHGVPPTRLAIFDLAAELVDAHGLRDLDGLAARQPELNLARAEAELYAQATRRAVEAVRRLPPV